MTVEATVEIINRQGAQIKILESRCQELAKKYGEMESRLDDMRQAWGRQRTLLADLEHLVEAARDVVGSADRLRFEERLESEA